VPSWYPFTDVGVVSAAEPRDHPYPDVAVVFDAIASLPLHFHATSEFDFLISPANYQRYRVAPPLGSGCLISQANEIIATAMHTNPATASRYYTAAIP
jgi:hypothetical protein